MLAEVIQRFVAQNAMEAFEVGVGFVRTVRNRDSLDAYDVRQPEVEVTTAALLPLSSPPASPGVCGCQRGAAIGPRHAGRDQAARLTGIQKYRLQDHGSDGGRWQRRTLMKVKLSRWCLGPLVLSGLSVGCGSGTDPSVTTAQGGAISQGGSAGGAATQGGAQVGGTPVAGAPNGGVSTVTGGVSNGGALPATGGASSGGAGPGTGGASSGGTLPATGGASSGGTGPGTGGVSSGGTLPATGGTGPGTGGVSSGGTGPGTGGASSGGAPSGGTGAGTPSDGCSATNVATGSEIDGTISVGGQQRTYRLSVPTDYVPGEPLPLVFGLNGVGGDGQGAQRAFGLEAGHRAVFIYPDSTPHPDAGGSTAWYFESDGVDVAFFDALIGELTSNYCIDMDRIFVVGISSGGIMSNMLGCFRGDVVRAIAPVSGMTWENSCTGSVAAMVINPCDTDAQGEVDFWTARNGCTSQTASSPISSICEEYQGCAPADPVLICRHDGGHIWPSGGADMVMSFFMGL
jgi:polyhydroxybutyrate depolymerase